MKQRPRAKNTEGKQPRSAPALRRLGAFGLDQVVVAAYLAGLFGLVWLVSQLGLGSVIRRAFEEPLRAQLFGLLLVTLPVVMYHAAWEGSRLGATPGKLLLGVRVAGAGGEALPLERATLRAGVKTLPWEISHTVLWRLPGWPGPVETFPPGALVGLAITWILIGAWLIGLFLDRDGRTPYDRVAGAVVVQVDPWSDGSSDARWAIRPRSGLPRRASRRSMRGMRPASAGAGHHSDGIER